MTAREKLRWRKAFSAALRELRESRGLSQEQLAFDISRHRTYVSQLERRLKSPTLETLVMICEYFRISLHEFAHMIEKHLNNKK